MNSIKLKACATVANLSCGFDVLGLCLDHPYDEIIIQKNKSKTVTLEILDSPYNNIPSNPENNTGGIPALLILNELDLNFGFDIKIKKGIPLCGGLGSSAATAAGVVFGINKLLNDKLSSKEMLKYALEGEKASVSNAHLDNVAPCLLGGLTLIKNTELLDVLKIPISDFHIAAVHPDIKIKTEDARNMLPDKVPLDKAVKQWGEVSSLVYGFSINDTSLIKRSMSDFIIEPIRKKLIKGFDKIKDNALKIGALGCSISGSGPSIFALCETEDIAKKVNIKMGSVLGEKTIKYHSYISPINNQGIEVL